MNESLPAQAPAPSGQLHLAKGHEGRGHSSSGWGELRGPAWGTSSSCRLSPQGPAVSQLSPRGQLETSQPEGAWIITWASQVLLGEEWFGTKRG